MSSSVIQTSETSNLQIAVVGLGSYYPGAGNLLTLWENVLARRSQFRSLPKQRLPLLEYYDANPAAPDKTYGDRAAVIDGFEFDWVNWRIPKAAFDSTDIVHWLALETATQALKDAGYSREQVPTQKTGVIVGNTLTGEQTRTTTLRLRWPYTRRALQTAAQVQNLSSATAKALIETMEQIYKSAFAPITEDSLAGGLSNTIAGRICNAFNLDGGGYTVDGACSSSLLAVITAANALSNRDLDLALAGGVDVSLDPFELIGFAKVGALTANGMSVYDRRSSGFIPGEGCGFVVLKRLEDAQAAGDYVYAVLNGWGISSDGKGGITAPSQAGQAKALGRAYAKARYSPHRLDFIEGHGTGTAVGDRVELEGIAAAVRAGGEIAPRSIGVTSFKSIVGHTKAAAGIGGLIKAVMAVNQRIIPPTAGCKDPNPVFDSSANCVYPILTGAIRPTTDTLHAGVSAMGFGGINSHVTLSSADAPAPHLKPALEERSLLVSHQDTELFVLSANSVQTLLERVQGAIYQAEGISLAEMTDLAAHLAQTLTQSQPVRAAIIASTPNELIERLQQLEHILDRQPLNSGEIQAFPQQGLWISNAVKRDRVGFLFPGQGSQKLNMGRVLVERHRWAQELVIQTDQWLQDRLAQPISHVLYRSLEKAVNSAELAQWQQDLAKTEVAQPALCLASVLWSRYLERLGIKPLAVGGHSLGELTAFHTAGAFDVETLLRLAAIRGQAMSGSGSSDRAGAMASLGCSELVTTSLLQSVQSDVVVANMNSHQQTVISGDRSSVETVVQLAAAQNIQTHLLPVSHAFHSPQVAAAADYLRDTAPVPETLSSLPIALFSSVRDAQVHLGINLREHFAMQVTSQVDFISLVKAMSPQCDLLIEVGSGRVLSELANAITNGETACLPVESKSGSDRDLNQVLATFFVQGGEINWDALYENRLVRPFIPASQRQFIENPCERPFQVPIATNPSSANVQVPQQLSQNGHQDSFNPMVAPPSDFDWTETLSNYFVQRGAFLAQVIRADLQTLPHLNDRNLTNYSSAIHSAQTTNGGMNEKAIDVPPQAPLVPAESGAIAELLLGLVEERTGFPKTTLTLNLRLLDDLNLDSIKAADLIATVAKRLGVGGKLDPSMLANATLADVVTTLQAAQPQTVSTPTIEAATDSGTNPINRSSWVRHFAIEFVPQALPANPSENWALATVLILADTVDSAVVQALQNHLSGLGAQVKSISYQQFTAKENGWNSFSHYLAILPQSNTSAALPLPQMMARLRSIVTPKSQPDACIAYVQFGGGNFGRNGKTHPASSCAAAFARTLHLERPELRVRVIDLASELAPDRVADLAIAELSGTEAIATVGYDANQVRRVPQARVQQPAQYRQRFSQGDANDKRSLGWSDQDVVLVTGGAKGITAECALAFAQAHGVKMALVGRSSAATDAEVRQTLARFQAAGLTCRYYSCDIVDGDAIASLIKTISAELGSITAVIHGAGLNQPRLLEQASLEAAQAEVSPKLLGAHNLLQALDPTALRMFVAFSSIIAVTGMPGNAWYGFANEALDISLCCFQQAHPSIQVLSIAYSIWDEVGMGARMGSVKTLKRMGISAIPVQEGVSRFLRLMEADPGTTQVLIAARLAGLDTWPPTPLPDATNLRFVEQVRYVEPGVELVARAHLSLERDRYIQDHIWRGYYLFPTVFGLEAMAQAVAYVTGNLKPAIARIEDISLQRPVVVDPTQGVEIEIYAEVMEASGNGEQQICVSIRTEQTDFSIDHFAAIVVLGKLASGELMPGAQTVQSDPVLADKALEINPQVDLYEGLLFQGKRFQQMGAIFALTSNTAVFQSNVQPNTELGIDSFSTELGQCLLLGDAYFRDVLLQSVQLTIPQNICLPIHIAKIEWFENPALEQEASDRGRIVTAQLLQQDGREYDAEVIATNEQGYITERISGYRLRILEEHPENPTAEQLAFPETRDRHQLQAVLGTTFQQLGIIPPAIALGYAPNLQAKPRDQRLQHEQLIVERALRDQLGLSSSEALDFGIRSQPSGKPELTGSVASFDVSLSHCDRYCLCVVGASPQGCDIEAIIPRDQDDWVALLSDAHSPIIDELVQQGDTRDRAAMRIWSALEAVRKAYSGANPEFSILKKQGDSVLLHASMPAGDCGVVTVPIRLTRPPERMIAIVVPLTQARASAPVTELDHCDRHFSGYTSDGPQGQPVYQQRFQVSFKESGSISRRIYFSQYFRWIGKIRELPMESIASQVLSDFFSGDWGMVTNAVSLRVLGEATAYDVLQARAWVGDVTGSSFTTYIEFCKVLPDGSLERLAITEVRATWVQLKSYGVPSPMPFPAYLAEYLEQFAPRQSALLDLTQPKILNLPPLPTTLTQLDLGAIVYQAPLHQSRSGMLLRSEVFQTTLEESNLVGNVYYGNYFIWQGRILDLFLYSVAPEYLRVSNPIGEMLCLYSRMDYLREAMPFDRIKTQLYVRSVSECGATFNFEFFREQFDGSLEKLHIGQQEVVWVERRADGSPVAAPLPSSVMQALVDCSISSPGMNSIRY